MKFYIESINGYSDESKSIEVMVAAYEENNSEYQAHYLANVPFSIDDTFLAVENKAIEMAMAFFKKASA